MRAQHNECETHHLTYPVCGALPGTACVDSDFQELPEVHPSRRMSMQLSAAKRRSAGQRDQRVAAAQREPVLARRPQRDGGHVPVELVKRHERDREL